MHARFEMDEQGVIGYTLGPYDSARPLVIDPFVRYAVFAGGAGRTAYVTGWSGGAAAPTIRATVLGPNGASTGVFAAKLSPKFRRRYVPLLQK